MFWCQRFATLTGSGLTQRETMRKPSSAAGDALEFAKVGEARSNPSRQWPSGLLFLLKLGGFWPKGTWWRITQEE
jgi:hypothetical protein